MRNPWVHDDMPDGTGSGHGGRVWLLGAVVWGALLLCVGGIALLVGTGAVDSGFAGSLGSAVTYVVAGAAAVLLLPIVLRLLAVSRLLGSVAFLAAGWLVGGFVWRRESDRIERLLPGDGGTVAGAGAQDEVVELLDLVLVVV